MQVISRSNAAKALEPACMREGAMPRQGGGAKREITSRVAVCNSQTATCDRGHITEEPCAAKVARTVLKQRWRERSLHRL